MTELTELKQKLLQSASLQEMCEAVLGHARTLTDSPVALVAEVVPGSRALVAVASAPRSVTGPTPVELTGWTASREPVVLNSTGSERAKALKLGRLLSVPLLHSGALLGELVAGSAGRDYGSQDLAALQHLASDLAPAMARVKAQQALEESRAQLQGMVDTAMDAIITVDDAGTIVLFNPAAERMFGAGSAEALGAPVHRYVTGVFPTGNPYASDRIRRSLAAARGRRSDRVEFPVEASISTVRVAGRRLSTAILRDVSERERTREQQDRLQRAVVQAAEDWRRTFDAMASAVIVLEPGGAVQRLNTMALKLLGGTYQELVGKPFAAGGKEPWATALRIAASGSGPGRERVCDEESGLWWEVTVTPMSVSGAARPRVIIEAEDVTAVVNLESSIERAERMAAMGALTAGVAHEVRNPLFAIAASVDALEAILTDQPPVAEIVQLMREQVDRLNKLMKELLVYGRPSGEETWAPEPLGPILEQAVRGTVPMAGSAGVAVTVQGDLSGFVVRADAGRLDEVVRNLLENAIQHSRAGDSVRLLVYGERDGRTPWVRVSVMDSGPGFRAEDIPVLFQPFYTRRTGGTGLGLSIVQRIVEQHHGRVTAGNLPHGGACVTFELPCVSPDEGPALASPEG